jgi:TatD DNase family protein
LNPQLIDTHAHLDFPQFDPDREEVINRSRTAGINIINTIGVDLPASRKAIALAEKYPGVFASIGIHPQEAGKAKREDISLLEEWAHNPRVIAIGELGLDFYRSQSTRESQLKVLNWELELARKVELPIIIHCREAQEYMLPVITDWTSDYVLKEGKTRGVLHCFNTDLETAEKYMMMGFYISLGAYIGYPSSSQLRQTIKDIPLDRLVLETDCPFLPPQKHRGQRNEPSYVMVTAGVLAEIKGLPIEEIALQTSHNAIVLFNLPRTD